jgi:DNA-binding ferritin-like protein (Dps family)
MTMSDNDAEKGGFISKVIGPKRRWRAYKARSRQLPASYRTAVDALERYLNYYGGAGSESPAIYEDLIDLFEQGAANGTSVREIVGEDPVEFVDEFVRNYPKGQWVIRERERLISAIERAAGEDTANEGISR